VVAIDDFLDVLADPQGIEHLHVGKAFEEIIGSVMQSARRISSIDSLRQTLAMSERPQLASSR
jgi:hypothetical protein